MESIGELLVGSGALTEEQLKEGLSYQRNRGLRLGEALEQLGILDEVTLTRHLAKQQGLPFVDLGKGRIADEVLEKVPDELAREQSIVPVVIRKGTLVVAVDDPLKRIVADQLSFVLGMEVACALAAPRALAAAIQTYYGADDERELAAGMGAQAGDEESDAPIVRLVTRMFQEALEMRASDIHIEPMAGRLRVRYRVDGVLREIADHPEHLAGPLTSRIKIMGSMDIAEKRKPQDGRIGMTIAGREVDVRASILPSNHGETIVLRLLDRSGNLLSLREVGFGPTSYKWFRDLIARPNGIVLVTGPTGSGKTTTLYAALAELNRPDVKIITAEDPVEYHIAGINQMQVFPRVGLTFARILKAMLRAAPNIILVGEIRDLETAEVAIQAALTGHLVFSTLHTNDAPSALTRLEDLGVKPFLVSTAVQGVLAQRLVRRLCPDCAESYTPEPHELEALGRDPSTAGELTFKRPRGCRACEGQGYRGRLGVFEMLSMNDTLREMVFRGASQDAVREFAHGSGGLITLLEDGASKVAEGRTSLAEILRVARTAAPDTAT